MKRAFFLGLAVLPIGVMWACSDVRPPIIGDCDTCGQKDAIYLDVPSDNAADVSQGPDAPVDAPSEATTDGGNTDAGDAATEGGDAAIDGAIDAGPDANIDGSSIDASADVSLDVSLDTGDAD